MHTVRWLIGVIGLSSWVLAQGEVSVEPTPEELQTMYESHVSALLEGEEYQTGDVLLPGKIAQLHLPEGYRFLGENAAKKVIVDLWGNPPDTAESTMGLVLPEGQAIEHPGDWAIVVEFTEDGYVSDEDANDMDGDQLLAAIQDGTRQANEERAAAGYETVEVVGWAVPPHYDKEHKVLHWAKELQFGDEGEGTINYDVRVLGRRGVLNLQAVASMESLPEIQAAEDKVAGMVEYLPGHRYADFDPSKDEKSELSLAGMVLGGAVAAKIAAKAGILAKLGLLFAKLWKAIAIGGVALVSIFKKKFSRGRA
ncbi:putative membrane-anchored protein [Haloferula luteola]|uniref:Putative membrane-anchored protein n=1 Tax=Haloferula luteola TaxID=595692 RepID=A0A840VH91_9BACT|nr:DUF2167 domain-containing protein [Haloferula luteola]MBB5353958.1 putative membrane-anchored protein [Haloferula luteola]